MGRPRTRRPWLALLPGALLLAGLLATWGGGHATDPRGHAPIEPRSDEPAPATGPGMPSDAAGLEGRPRKAPTPDAQDGKQSAPTRLVEILVRARGTRTPLAGARLRVFPHETPPHEAPAQVVEADGEGRARVRLPEGQAWYVEARAEGYEPRRLVLMRHDRGPRRATLDLRPGGVVRGRIVRTDGGPLAGDVWLVYAGGNTLRAFLENHDGPAPVKTGPDGRFVLPGVALGRTFTLKAQASDGAVGAAPALRLQADDARTRNDVRVAVRAPGRIRFRLVAPDGRPYLGGRLFLRPLAVHGDDTDVDERSPGEGGRVAYDALAPGSYVITYHHDELRPTRVGDGPIVVRPGETTDLGDLHLGSGRRVEGRLVIEAGDDDDLQGLRLKLFDATRTFWTHTREGGVFVFHDVAEGRFHLEIDSAAYRLREWCVVEAGAEGLVLGAVGAGASVQWTVRDESGRPIPAFDTYIVDTGPPGSPVREQVSGADGALRSDGLPPGAYDLMVQAPGFALWRKEAVQIERGEATEVEAVLQPAREIRRRVVGPDGQPIPRALATLTYRSDVPYGRTAEHGVDLEEATLIADAQGVLRLRPERPDLALSVQAPGFAPVRHPLRALPDGPIRLAPGVTVSGRVRTASGEAPGRVHIALDPAGRHVSFGRTAWTDEAGAFRVEDLAAGTWTVRAHSLRGDVVLEHDVAVEAPTTHVGTIRLP